MEKETLIIKNFGPIKDVELKLGRFNVLIGEQATGKSTVAKVLAVCRYFSYIYSDNSNVPSDNFESGLRAWGLQDFIQSDSFIYYKCDDYIFSAERVKRSDIILVPVNGDKSFEYTGFSTKLESKSEKFRTLIKELNTIKPVAKEGFDIPSLLWTIPTSFFLNDVKRVMDNPFYLPTQRGLQSIFDIGQASIKNLSNALFNQFSRLDGIARLFKQETYIEPLDIYYINRDGHGFIRKANEEKYYSLYNAASGYQSMIPIVLVVKYYIELKKKTKTLIIEEPELDVFPSAQNKLVQYLSDKAKAYESMILLTTHSPYVLTSLNNMMFAYRTGESHYEEVTKIINEKYWLNPDDVSAYMMKTDGTCENIMDDEVKQIKAEKIDEISRQFNKEYDAMLDIKYPAA